MLLTPLIGAGQLSNTDCQDLPRIYKAFSSAQLPESNTIVGKSVFQTSSLCFFPASSAWQVALMNLSKSRFVAGVQCVMRLHWQVHNSELAAEQTDFVRQFLSRHLKWGASHSMPPLQLRITGSF